VPVQRVEPIVGAVPITDLTTRGGVMTGVGVVPPLTGELDYPLRFLQSAPPDLFRK